MARLVSMTSSEQAVRRQRTRERRRERAERILDATAELVLRWGYRKTTLDDIARRADVGKGTLFLHWKSRHALFHALLRRERVALLSGIRAALDADPGEADLRGLIRWFLLVVLDRPLMRAVFTGDTELLGRLADAKRTSEVSQALRAEFTAYLETLRRHALVRTDLSAAEQTTIATATCHGFYTVLPFLPEQGRPPAERYAELCAETVCRALAPEGRAVETEEMARATFGYLDGVLRIAQERYRFSLGEDGEAEEPEG